MKAARAMAHALRSKPSLTPCDLTAAAATIDTLLDIIEMQRGPAVVPPSPDMQPLRELRAWHVVARDTANNSRMRAIHAEAIESLNRYFTDKL